MAMEHERQRLALPARHGSLLQPRLQRAAGTRRERLETLAALARPHDPRIVEMRDSETLVVRCHELEPAVRKVERRLSVPPALVRRGRRGVNDDTAAMHAERATFVH